MGTHYNCLTEYPQSMLGFTIFSIFPYTLGYTLELPIEMVLKCLHNILFEQKFELNHIFSSKNGHFYSGPNTNTGKHHIPESTFNYQNAVRIICASARDYYIVHNG